MKENANKQISDSSTTSQKERHNPQKLFCIGVLLLIMGGLRFFFSEESFMSFFTWIGHGVLYIPPVLYDIAGIAVAVIAIWFSPTKKGKIFDGVLIILGIAALFS